MPRQPSVDPRHLVELLCTDMSETERARQLGIARSSYYDALDRLARDGILWGRTALAKGMTITGAHPTSARSHARHTPVLHVSWPAGLGRWSVQGALLDAWDKESKSEAAVIVRWAGKTLDIHSFVVMPPTRWSTKDTKNWTKNMWMLTRSALEELTIAIARVLDAEAMLIPEGW